MPASTPPAEPARPASGLVMVPTLDLHAYRPDPEAVRRALHGAEPTPRSPAPDGRPRS